jgi:gluconolactonase
MRTFVIGMIVAVIVATAYTAQMPAAENRIVPEGAKLELLYTRSANIKGGLTEGPAVAPDGSTTAARPTAWPLTPTDI